MMSSFIADSGAKGQTILALFLCGSVPLSLRRRWGPSFQQDENHHRSQRTDGDAGIQIFLDASVGPS
jgi:hypothetical protein